MADQLYACYARAREVERMRLIVGDDGLTSLEKPISPSAACSRRTFSPRGRRGAPAASEKIAWKCLSVLPASELFKLPENYVAENMGREGGRS
ncbi:hypothetical protein MASR2M79_14580 [Aminivibrio sp.]